MSGTWTPSPPTHRLQLARPDPGGDGFAIYQIAALWPLPYEEGWSVRMNRLPVLATGDILHILPMTLEAAEAQSLLKRKAASANVYSSTLTHYLVSSIPKGQKTLHVKHGEVHQYARTPLSIVSLWTYPRNEAAKIRIRPYTDQLEATTPFSSNNEYITQRDDE